MLLVDDLVFLSNLDLLLKCIQFHLVNLLLRLWDLNGGYLVDAILNETYWILSRLHIEIRVLVLEVLLLLLEELILT